MRGHTSFLVVLGLAAVFLLQHLLFLPRSLEDIDSVNFALALHDFNIAKHQPHPPGYPVFVALGRAAREVVAVAWPDMSPAALDARALALCGTVLGAFGTFPLWWFFRRLEGDDRRALAATTLTLLTPLMWFNASRPMSDVSGLAFIWTAQALIVAWMARAGLWPTERRVVDEGQEGTSSTRDTLPRPLGLFAAAFVSGLAGGVRSQLIVLTLPLLVLALILASSKFGWAIWRRAAGAYGAGLATWLIPLLVYSGGPSRFLSVLTAQAREDFGGVQMLATTFTPRGLAFGLVQTFAYPWASRPLAGVVLGLATCGGLVLLLRARSVALILITAALPYAVFHLAFHETFTTRYALPLIAPVAYLTVRGIDGMASRLMPVLVAMIAVAGLAATIPAQIAYADQGSPVFRAINDFEAAKGVGARRPALGMHSSIVQASRHRLTRDHAFLGQPGVQQIANALLRDGAAPVWFLADSRRTDLIRLDANGRRLHRAYRWGFNTRTFLGGVRPRGVDLVEVARPGWIVGEGWSLTPELAGRTTRAGLGPMHAPIVAHLRSRDEGAAVLLGGRRPGGPSKTDVEFTLKIGDRDVDRWVVAAEREQFLRTWMLPPGALAAEQPWVDASIAARVVNHRSGADVIITQFDVQPLDRVVTGFDQGWYRQEYDPATGGLWRWSSDSAAVRILSRQGVRIVVRADPPVGLDPPPIVTLRAGAREIARANGRSSVTWDLVVPADVLEAAHGVVHLETTRTFVPFEHSRSSDHRRLGLQVWRFDVRPLLK
jgi:hypothetical protein